MAKNKFKFVLNRQGVSELLKGDKMQALLKEKADGAVTRAGDGFESDVYVGQNRANASVSAKTYKAKKDNLKNNTILKSLQ